MHRPITPKLHHSNLRIMNDLWNKTIVLVLNRNWQAINVRTPQDAFCQMATKVCCQTGVIDVIG